MKKIIITLTLLLLLGCFLNFLKNYFNEDFPEDDWSFLKAEQEHESIDRDVIEEIEKVLNKLNLDHLLTTEKSFSSPSNSSNSSKSQELQGLMQKIEELSEQNRQKELEELVKKHLPEQKTALFAMVLIESCNPPQILEGIKIAEEIIEKPYTREEKISALFYLAKAIFKVYEMTKRREYLAQARKILFTITQYPTDHRPEAYFILAKIYFQKRDLVETLLCLNSALTQKQISKDLEFKVLMAKAEILYRIGDTEEARKVAQRAKKKSSHCLDPQDREKARCFWNLVSISD